MTTKELRDIQATGTSHDTIDAIITYLESKETPNEEVKAKKVTKK